MGMLSGIKALEGKSDCAGGVIPTIITNKYQYFLVLYSRRDEQ
jgi:hypothetical protein